WYDPDIYLTSTGDLNIVKDENENYVVKRTESTFAKATVDKVGAFAEIVVGKIRAGIIETKQLIVDGVDIVKKLNELSNKINSQQKEIDELKKEIEELKK
ncbi:MAG: hypothetical protein V1803_03055, partial [Candidatus Roizmanbacteria bacterium]